MTAIPAITTPSPLLGIPDWRRLARGVSQAIPDWRRLQRLPPNWRRVQTPFLCVPSSPLWLGALLAALLSKIPIQGTLQPIAEYRILPFVRPRGSQ
jgi:hypothetical protein